MPLNCRNWCMMTTLNDFPFKKGDFVTYDNGSVRIFGHIDSDVYSEERDEAAQWCVDITVVEPSLWEFIGLEAVYVVKGWRYE